jgi:flagellin
MIVSHNINSLRTANRLTKVEKASSESMKKVSSGLKINDAADDAAGTSISATLKAQIRGLSRAQINIQEGLNLSRVMTNSLDLVVNNSLNRMRELSIQGASDTSGDYDREAMQDEVGQILKDIDSIAKGTEYNGRKLLSPPLDPIYLQIGANYRDSFKIELFDVGVESLGLTDVNVNSKENSLRTLDQVDSAISLVVSYVAKAGAYETGLQYFSGKLLEYEEKLTLSNSQIEDADLAKESLKLAQSSIITQATQAILVQANQLPESVIQLLK